MDIIAAAKLAKEGKTLYSKSSKTKMYSHMSNLKPMFHVDGVEPSICPWYAHLLATDWEVV